MFLQVVRLSDVREDCAPGTESHVAGDLRIAVVIATVPGALHWTDGGRDHLSSVYVDG